jgi:hypothetical protein
MYGSGTPDEKSPDSEIHQRIEIDSPGPFPFPFFSIRGRDQRRVRACFICVIDGMRVSMLYEETRGKPTGAEDGNGPCPDCRVCYFQVAQHIFLRCHYAMHGIGDDADGKRTALMG